MIKKLCGGRARFAILVVGLFGIAACTAADYSDGISGFSQAVTTAANLGQPLATAAQQTAQNQAMRMLIKNDSAKISISDGCKLPVDDSAEYHPGDCVLSIDNLKLNYANTVSDMGSLTKYAAALSAVVADQTCASLQTDAKDLATTVSDIATRTKAPAAAAAAGPISQIVAAAGCGAINDVQLRILKASTDAANSFIQKLVPLIVAKYNELYMIALTEAHTQLLSSMTDYLIAQNSYRQSKSLLDLDKEKSSLTQAIALTAAIDNAKSNPPGPVVLNVATLHQNLTNDLKSPTVNLKRVLNDAQAFVTEATSAASAVDALTKANSKASK